MKVFLLMMIIMMVIKYNDDDANVGLDTLQWQAGIEKQLFDSNSDESPDMI